MTAENVQIIQNKGVESAMDLLLVNDFLTILVKSPVDIHHTLL